MSVSQELAKIEKLGKARVAGLKASLAEREAELRRIQNAVKVLNGRKKSA